MMTAAPVWRRWLAMGLDALPIATLWLLLTWPLVAATPAPEHRWNLLDQAADFVQAHPGVVAASLGIIAALGFAYPLFGQLFWSATPGKRLLGLTVVRRHDGAPVSPARTAAHCALRVLGVLALLIGPLWVLADPERRTLHDRLAGVIVIRDTGLATVDNGVG